MTTAAPSGLNAREADRLRKAGFPEAAIAEIDAALKRNPGFRRRRWWRFVLTGVFALAGFLIGVSGAMVNVLAHGLVDNSYFVNDLAIVFMLLLALLQAVNDTPATENAA